MKAKEVFKRTNIESKEISEWRKFKKVKTPLIDGWKRRISEINK